MLLTLSLGVVAALLLLSKAGLETIRTPLSSLGFACALGTDGSFSAQQQNFLSHQGEPFSWTIPVSLVPGRCDDVATDLVLPQHSITVLVAGIPLSFALHICMAFKVTLF